MSLIMQYPTGASDSTTESITLPSPEIGDSLIRDQNYAIRENRNLDLVGSKVTTRPITEQITYNFACLTTVDADSLRDFFSNTAGQNVELVDHNGVRRIGYIHSPSNEFVNVRDADYVDVTFTFIEMIDRFTLMGNSSAASHTLFIDSAGRLYGRGRNLNSQVNTVPTSNETTWVLMHDTIRFVSCAANLNVTFAISTEGYLYTCGDNGYYQTAQGTDIGDTTVLTQIGTKKWLQVAAGDSFAAGIDENGIVYSWGRNSGGRTGQGTSTGTTNTPTTTGVSATSIACGYYNIYANDGVNVYNTGGGNGNVSAEGLITLEVIEEITNVISIAAGYDYVNFLKADGSVWSVGNNWYGIFGDGTFLNTSDTLVEFDDTTTYLQIAASGNHSTVGISSGRILRGWGLNSDGIIGDGTKTQRLSPVAATTIKKFKQITAGRYHALAIDVNNILYGAGRNSDYQIHGADTNDITTHMIVPLPGEE